MPQTARIAGVSPTPLRYADSTNRRTAIFPASDLSWVADHFGGPPVDYYAFHYAGTAAQALRQLDEAYAAWLAGVKSLGDGGLARPCGPAEGPFAEFPMATLVLHVNREALHHGAEIALLRDLYANR